MNTNPPSHPGPIRRVAGLLLLLQLSATAMAQSTLSNFVFTVGTSARDAAGSNWSYVAIDSPAPAVLAGRRIAVYRKAGHPTNAGPFTLRGTMAPATAPGTINTLLNQSVALGQNLASLSNTLNGVLRHIPGISNQPLAQKVLTAFQAAAANTATAELMDLLGKANPGLQLCAGSAFSEALPTTSTYELREIDALTGAASHVVGRVTIVPNAPVVLPAPGRPFQVMTNNPSDHLLIRLRWGTPPELRRLSLLGFGYNLWRIPRAAAEAGNFVNVPPTPAQLRSNTNFTRANVSSAIMARKEFSAGTGPGAADDPADQTTYFFADDGRATRGTNFSNGQEFYYFVTARDLLGRDGLASPGGLARACRRRPPAAPGNLRVENTVLPGSTNLPRLRLGWDQNTDPADGVGQYWIYRWPNPASALTNETIPLSHRVAIVAQRAGTNRNDYVDTSAGALTNANPTNVWYTVRAVSTNACDLLISAATAPQWGVLREHRAPDATTGGIVGSCGVPVAMLQLITTNFAGTLTQQWSFRLTCTRRDRGIEWVQFTVTDRSGTRTNFTTLGPIYFPPDGDTVRIEHVVPDDSFFDRTQHVACIVGNARATSPEVTVQMPHVSSPGLPPRQAIFSSGTLLTTALDSTDPLLLAHPNAMGAFQAPTSVVPDANGMVAIRFGSAFPGNARLIQAQSDGAWRDIGVVIADAAGVFWVSYPACLIGPVPPFRGCALNLPKGNQCSWHIARAGEDGRIAPVEVSFPLTPRTREYRVFRQTEDGPLSMFAQGPANYSPNAVIQVKDEVMPVSGARLCYFVQLLDEHGNGSPLSMIGCRYVPPTTKPRPVLSEPTPAGVVSDPQVVLTWFCPTAGVRQFEVKIHRVVPPGSVGPSLLSSKLRPYVAYNKSSIFEGLKSSTLRFDEAQMTPPIGAEFGPGPQFTLTASVLPNVEYEIAVTAVDGQGEPMEGATSEIQRFTWSPPVVMASVPWPARPLPPVRDFDDVPLTNLHAPYRVKAVLMQSTSNGLDKRYPLGVAIGDVSRVNISTAGFVSNIGTTNSLSYSAPFPNPDPEEALVYRRNSNEPSRHGESLLPLIVYRQQVANTNFTRVSGDIIQVSPLIERIPWNLNLNRAERLQGYGWSIPDRLFGHTAVSSHPNVFHLLCVRDLQPALQGATYRYWVVRFNALREPEEVIPAGEVYLH